MKRKRSQSNKIRVFILCIGILILLILLLPKQNKEEKIEFQQVFSSQYVYANEIPGYLSFCNYSKQEWEEVLKGNLSEKITYHDVTFLLKKLGVQNYIKVQNDSDETISRTEFTEIYTEILEYLDESGVVSLKQVQIDKSANGNDNKTIVLASDKFYTWDAPTVYAVQDQCYLAYVMQENIIGIQSRVPQNMILNPEDEENTTTDTKLVRVLIKNQDLLYWNKIYLTCDTAFKVTANGETRNWKANKIIDASTYSIVENGFLKIEQSGGRIYICDKKGNKKSYGYQGSFSIYKYEDGYALINELDTEDYLCDVVPSEMPSSFELEALKAQAVCARSYLLSQMEQGDYTYLKAHIDDSTSYQAYNKQSENRTATQAVFDTKGQVLKYQGKIITAYYFSTSCGLTSSYTLWNLDQDDFGYLAGTGTSEYGAMNKEKSFQAYLKKDKITSADSESPYFRWTCRSKLIAKSAAIRQAIQERKIQAPDTVSINYKTNVKKTITSLGKIKAIEVSKRNKSGCIQTLKITFQKGTVTLLSEYTIRFCLGAAIQTYTLQDGSTREAQLMPSAYFYLVRYKNGTYRIYGGGYGHGVGMSQYGANGMAQNGSSYKEILLFFYHDVQLE